MVENKYKNEPTGLPLIAEDFINLIIKKMRYRKKVRQEVKEELTAHFEDELKDCKDHQERSERARKLIDEFGDVKLLGLLLHRAKKRCRPMWRTSIVRTFQSIGSLIICFILYMVWFLTGKPAVTVDYLTELNKVIIPVTDEKQNAASFFQKAVELCPAMPERKNAEFFGDPYPGLTNAEKELVKDLVEKSSESIQFIESGVKKKYFWREYKTSGDEHDDGSLLGILMPDLADFRNIACIICYRAQIQAESGDYSKAFDDLITCYKFGKIIDSGEKTLIEQLVGIAIQAISTKNIRVMLYHYQVPKESLAVLQQKFSVAQQGQDYKMHVLTEKMMIYDEIQRSFTDDRFGGGHPYPKRLMNLGNWTGDQGDEILDIVLRIQNWDNAVRFLFFHPNKTETRQQADEFYAFFEKKSKMTPFQLKENQIDLDEIAKKMSEGNILIQIMMPALGKVHEVSYRLKADIESMPLIIAALRYKADKGKYPEDQAELKENGYIEQIPIDPFSDKPLVYKRTEDGFILYSISLNFTDNSGKMYKDREGKPRLWDHDEGDAVFWPVQE